MCKVEKYKFKAKWMGKGREEKEMAAKVSETHFMGEKSGAFLSYTIQKHHKNPSWQSQPHPLHLTDTWLSADNRGQIMRVKKRRKRSSLTSRLGLFVTTHFSGNMWCPVNFFGQRSLTTLSFRRGGRGLKYQGSGRIVVR